MVRFRRSSWELLLQLHRSHTLPWLCAGDFNEIMCESEKLGGAARPSKQMEDFRRVSMECNLQKVPFTGPKFTWSRGKGSNMILECLDRGMANEEWYLLFPMAKVIHLSTISSDHTPLMFHIFRQPWQVGRTKRSFYFENMWVRHSGCESLDRKSVV